MAGVVVGVDGSPHSLVALRLAADEARCRSGQLHIVYAYEPVRASHTDVAATVAAGSVTSPEVGETMLRQAARRDEEDQAEARRHADAWLRQFVANAEADLTGLDVERSTVSDEHPSAALVRLSQAAELLVVGSRGLGGFAGVLLGSVGQHCVRHATCSVLVARS